MKRDWIVAALAIGAVALIVTWIARNTYWDYESSPSALKGEAVTNPFYAAQRFAEALGARTERREALGTLPADGIVVLAYWHWSLIEARRVALESWVENGGRLVVGPTLIGGEAAFEGWAGVSHEQEEYEDEDEEAGEGEETGEVEEDSLGAAEEPRCSTLELTAGVAQALRDQYEVCSVTPDSWLTSTRKTPWSLSDEFGAQAIRIEIGNGSVTVLNATPFGNRDLTKVDHAALFVDLTQLRRGDQVIFLSEAQRPSLLSLTWTHGAPVVVLCLIALALALWRNGRRFGPLAAAPDPSRRSIAEQIRGTGQFMMRFGNQAMHGAMVRALQETAQRYIAGYANLSPEEQIQAIAQLTGTDAQALAEMINYRGPRRTGDLRNAITALELARRRIVEARDTKRSKHAS